jgi:hypothetical protein
MADWNSNSYDGPPTDASTTVYGLTNTGQEFVSQSSPAGVTTYFRMWAVNTLDPSGNPLVWTVDGTPDTTGLRYVGAGVPDAATIRMMDTWTL